MAKPQNPAPAPVGKGHATPTRREREAARKRPLVLDRKADSAKRRADRRLQYEREQKAMVTGDDRNMPAQHAGAPRRYARDFVDARTTVAEFLLPASLVALFAMMFLGGNKVGSSKPEVVTTLSFALLLTILAAAIESAILIRRLHKAAAAKFGEEKLPRLYRLYALTRMLQLRRLRMPKAQIKRGEFPL